MWILIIIGIISATVFLFRKRTPRFPSKEMLDKKALKRAKTREAKLKKFVTKFYNIIIRKMKKYASSEGGNFRIICLKQLNDEGVNMVKDMLQVDGWDCDISSWSNHDYNKIKYEHSVSVFPLKTEKAFPTTSTYR